MSDENDQIQEPRGDLAEFIRDTITQVAMGTADSQEAMFSLGGQVNPIGAIPKIEGMPAIPIPNGRNGYLLTIDFDIAVTKQSGKSGTAGGGLRVVGLSAGGKLQESSDNTHISRIQFSLPVVLPGQPNEETEEELRRRRKAENERLRNSSRSNWVKRF